MNKKALLKEIRKHPDGSKMLSLGYSPSFIHNMLLEQQELNEDNVMNSVRGNWWLRSIREFNKTNQNIQDQIKYIEELVAQAQKAVDDNDLSSLFPRIAKSDDEVLKKKYFEALQGIINTTSENKLGKLKSLVDAQEKPEEKVKTIQQAVTQATGENASDDEKQKTAKEIVTAVDPNQANNQELINTVAGGDEQGPDKNKTQAAAEIIGNLANQFVDDIGPDLTAAAKSNDEEEKKKAGQAFASVAGDEQKLDQPDTDAFKKNSKAAGEKATQKFQQIKQQDAGEDDQFAELKQQYGESEFMKIVKEEEKAVVYKFLKALKDQGVLSEGKEEMRNFVKSLNLDPGKLRKVLMGMEQKERIIIIRYIKQNNELFIKMLQQGRKKEEPKANEEELNKEASVDYAKAFEKFEKDFLTETYLKDQGNVFNDLFAIVAQISGKEVDEFDQEELALTDRNPEAGDAEPMKEGKEDVIQLYQQSLIPQTNKMQRNTDKIMDILEDYDKYLNGNLKGGLKRGSRSLFQKYGEMNPRKLLFNVLRTTMKDIATLEDLLDEYEANFDQDEKEEKPQEKLQENQDLADLPVREKVAKVKEVYQRVISKEGLAIYNRLKTTDPTRKDREDRSEVGMEEQIIKEVFRLLKEEEGGDQQNIRELCGVVYDVMVPIRVFFPNVSPFGTKYQINQATSGLRQTLKNFARIVLAINNTAKDKRVLRDTSELRSKLLAIENNLHKYFGVEKFKRMSKVAAVNDEGQKAAEEGKAEDTDEFLKDDFELEASDEQSQTSVDDFVSQLISSDIVTDDEVVDYFYEFLTGKKQTWFSNLIKGFNFIKSKIGLNEQEMGKDVNTDDNIKATLLDFQILFKKSIQRINQNRNNPKVKRLIKTELSRIFQDKRYTAMYKLIQNIIASKEAINTLNGIDPKSFFSGLTKVTNTSWKSSLRLIPRLYKTFRGKSKFKGIFVLSHLASMIMLAYSKMDDFSLEFFDEEIPLEPLPYEDFVKRYDPRINKIQSLLSSLDEIPDDKLYDAFKAQLQDIENLKEAKDYEKLNVFADKLRDHLQQTIDTYKEVLDKFDGKTEVPAKEIEKIQSLIDQIASIPKSVGITDDTDFGTSPKAPDAKNVEFDDEEFKVGDLLFVNQYSNYANDDTWKDGAVIKKIEEDVYTIESRDGSDKTTQMNKETLKKNFKKPKRAQSQPDEEEDKPETQGLEKYAKDNTEKQILEEFFRLMKQLNESFVSDFLQASGNDGQLNSKVANALGKMKAKDLITDDELKWLKTTLIKMVKEDRDLFNQQAGIVPDKPEQDSEKAKENQEELVANVITDTYEEMNTEDLEDEDFVQTFADEAVKNADPFLTPDEARSIDPNAVINRPEVQYTFDQYSNETGNDFNSEEFLFSFDHGLDNDINDEINSEENSWELMDSEDYGYGPDLSSNQKGSDLEQELKPEEEDELIKKDDGISFLQSLAEKLKNRGLETDAVYPQRFHYYYLLKDKGPANEYGNLQTIELDKNTYNFEKFVSDSTKPNKGFPPGENVSIIPADRTFYRISSREFYNNYKNKSKTKQEQIERKLETIIEHYLNTGKL